MDIISIQERGNPTCYELIEIGELSSESLTVRTGDKEMTIFDSTGIALPDLDVSMYILLKAEELNIGTLVTI